MRSERASIVTYRSGFNFAMGILTVVLVVPMVPAVAIYGNGDVPRPVAVALLLAFMALGWTMTISPRVELHDDHILVVTYRRKVGFSYNEIRSAEFDGYYFMMGRLLRIVGKADRVTVWPGGGARPPGWQVQLQAELKDRMKHQT